MSYLNIVSMLIASLLHCYVHVIFERRFYVDCVVKTLRRLCHMWTSFLCWLCRHYIVPFMSYLNVVSMLIMSSLHCYVHVIFGRRFYVDCVVITLLRSCHI